MDIPNPLASISSHVVATYYIKVYMRELEQVYSISKKLVDDIPTSVREKAPEAVAYADQSVQGLRSKLDSMVAWSKEAREISKEERKKLKKEIKASGKKSFPIARTLIAEKKKKKQNDDLGSGPAASLATRLLDPWREWDNLVYFQDQIALAMNMLTVAIALYK